MTKTVLVVDDDSFILAALQTVLSSKGLKVISLTNPQEAFIVAKKKRPDLIISDVNMPGMDGFTLLSLLKSNAETKGIPVIMLTAANKVGDVEKGFALGSETYLTKPITDWDRTWSKINLVLKVK